MIPGLPFKERVERILRKKSDLDAKHSPNRPTVMVATMDQEIRYELTELFQSFSFNTIWMQCVEGAKSILANEKVDACLCGLWLQDGTYRELVRHVRRERADIPVIIVSGPTGPKEYCDYLAAMNLGALDFLCHPYRKSELERMLRLAMGAPYRQQAGMGPNLQASEAA